MIDARILVNDDEPLQRQILRLLSFSSIRCEGRGTVALATIDGSGEHGGARR